MIASAVEDFVISPCSWITSGSGSIGCKSTATMVGLTSAFGRSLLQTPKEDQQMDTDKFSRKRYRATLVFD